MRDRTRAGRSPARACGEEAGVTRPGDRLIGARIVAAARVAAAMHLSAAQTPGPNAGARRSGVRPAEVSA